MSALEKAELFIIGALTITSYFFAPMVITLSIGTGVIWLAVVIFIQSLTRDLVLMVTLVKSGEPVKKHCICLESVVGLGCLLAGFLLLFSNYSIVLLLNKVTQVASIFSVLIAGFLIKNLVLTWRPFGVRREKNHMNVIVKW